MLRKILIMFVSVIFIWIQTSISYAQNYHFNAFDHMKNTYAKSKINSRGLTGQVGIRIPFGVHNKNTKKSFYGFKLTYGQEFRNSNPYQYGSVRDLNLLQSGFSANGLQSLNFANYDLLNEEKRLDIFGNGNGNGNGMTLIILLAIAAGGTLWALGVFSSDENASESGSSGSS